MKINTPPQTYIIRYEYRVDDNWDFDTIEVKASSEEEAINKAKLLVPRSARKDKLIAKLKENRKMKVSEAKKFIREQIMSSLSEKKKKEEEVETSEEEIVDEVPPEGDETPAEPTVDPNIKSLQTALTKLQATAKNLSDDKLDRQISNLITYITRTHISQG